MSTAASALMVEPVSSASPVRQRVDSIDLLRGFVMVVMMLDHTRDFWHSAAFQFDPTDLTKTYGALFFTRWITHFCAPTFFFLAGTGAYLRRAKGGTARELSHFLWTRGLWLIVLEITVFKLAMMFTLDPGVTLVLTIWALGWSMIALSLLVYLPVSVIGAFGVAMIVLHNLFDKLVVAPWSPGKLAPSVMEKLAIVLHQPAIFPIGHSPKFIVFSGYPLIPWIGVMAAGYAFGRLYTMDAPTRRRGLVRLGGGLILLFVALRAANIYGDASRWATQKSAALTLMSFLNTTKYPPSLLYLCMTLGPAILALAFLERNGRGPLGRAFVTFGRVPMFFYGMQWFVAHGGALIAYSLAGKPTSPLFGVPGFSAIPPADLATAGFSLPVAYLAWIGGVLLLYPLCKWFAEVKRRRNDWWLSYL